MPVTHITSILWMNTFIPHVEFPVFRPLLPKIVMVIFDRQALLYHRPWCDFDGDPERVLGR